MAAVKLQSRRLVRNLLLFRLSFHASVGERRTTRGTRALGERDYYRHLVIENHDPRIQLVRVRNANIFATAPAWGRTPP